MFKPSLLAIAISGFVSLNAAADTQGDVSNCLASASGQPEKCTESLTAKADDLRQERLSRLQNQKPKHITGEYASYLGGDLKKLNSPLLKTALRNEGRHLQVRVSPLDANGDYDIKLTSKDLAGSDNQGALLLSNTGPDLTGRDILSWYNRAKLGDGYVLVSSLTHGFSDLRPESKGGKYEAAFAGLEKATPYGIFELQYLHSVSENGGENASYELGGKTNRFSGSFRHWLTNSASLKHQITHTIRSQDFGAFDFDETQKYTMYRPSLNIDHRWGQAGISLSKGLGGSQDYSAIPLMGTFNPDFWSAQIDLSARKHLTPTVMLAAKVSAFNGSEDMPSSERFRLGGDGAGTSHESGLFSGYKGHSYDLSMHKYIGTFKDVKVSASAGVNGANITTATEKEIGVDSLELGLSAKYKQFSAATSLSQSINTKSIEDDTRLNVNLVWSY